MVFLFLGLVQLGHVGSAAPPLPRPTFSSRHFAARAFSSLPRGGAPVTPGASGATVATGVRAGCLAFSLRQRKALTVFRRYSSLFVLIRPYLELRPGALGRALSVTRYALFKKVTDS